jgi:CTD small phosphatase-like protein 2
MYYILDENKTWLDKSNYKSYLQTNNNLSKQILLNLFTQLKLFFKKNHYKELNNIKIENSINLLKSFLNTFSKKKIINILKEINNSSEINYLLELTQIDKIACNYDGKNMLNEEENRIFNEQNLKIPFLKPISSKYKYTLVLDLDETLVHYISDIDSAYIQIRPGAEEFLKDLSKYYEIIIFTAALQTYADLVIDGIDPDGVISDRLYRQHTICIGNTNIKDLTKIGRDLKHVIIIDNFLENYSLQPQNGLNIMDFEGNEYDDELNYLKEDLIKLVKMNPDDVRNHLKDIQINMDKRAAYFQKLNEDNNYQNETLHGYNDEENNNLFSEIINQNNTASQNNEKNGYNDSDGSENIDN